MGIIYAYTNKINNKKYIGQTINPKERFYAHKSNHLNPNSPEYNSVIHQAFRKYGYENFSYEVLAKINDDTDTLNELEKFYIKTYNTLVPNGYNVEPGGNNAPKPKNLEQRIKLTWGQAELTEEEIIDLRKAYANKESPKKIYDEKYKDRLHYNAFLNIWAGRRYKNIMPELIENGRHTKLNQEIADEIRKTYKEEKISYQKIAERFNISKATVADIIKGRTWKNV